MYSIFEVNEMREWLIKNKFTRVAGCAWYLNPLPDKDVCFTVWLHGERGQAEIRVNGKIVHRTNRFDGPTEAQQFFFGNV